MPNPDIQRARCERCSAPARVFVLEGYVDGQPVRHHFCLECADSAYRHYLDRGAGVIRPRLSFGSLLIIVGLLLTAVGASVDELGLHGSGGFGWKQQGGLLIGMVVLVLGALLRVDILAIVGAILVGAAALADVFGPVGSPGVGWKQGALILAGLLVLAAGIFMRRRRAVQSLPPTG
jgi:hypothetical protein